MQEMLNFTGAVRQHSAKVTESGNTGVTKGIILSQGKFFVSVANSLPPRGGPEAGALVPCVREA